jgi:hypothetical protein
MLPLRAMATLRHRLLIVRTLAYVSDPLVSGCSRTARGCQRGLGRCREVTDRFIRIAKKCKALFHVSQVVRTAATSITKRP